MKMRSTLIVFALRGILSAKEFKAISTELGDTQKDIKILKSKLK